MGLPPQACFETMIRWHRLEDSQTGCRAAAGAGAVVVAVPNEYSRNQDFGVASLVVESLSDLQLYGLLGLSVP